MTGPDRQQRLTLGPLLDWIGADRLSDRQIAARLDVAAESVGRYRRGGVPMSSADAMALHVGSHPAILWPDDY